MWVVGVCILNVEVWVADDGCARLARDGGVDGLMALEISWVGDE